MPYITKTEFLKSIQNVNTGMDAEKYLQNIIFKTGGKSKQNDEEMLIEQSTNNNIVKLHLNIDIALPAHVFNVNFRNNLIEILKKNHESRAYYIFFLKSIDYRIILETELSYIIARGEFYHFSLCLPVELVVYRKQDIVEMNLHLVVTQNNRIHAYATNEYLHCTIELKSNSSQYFVLNPHTKNVQLRDNLREMPYENNSLINVMINEFLSNQIDTGFTPKINCTGEIVYF